MEGVKEGPTVGTAVGDAVGAVEGPLVGANDGVALGAIDGDTEGTWEGTKVGAFEGAALGAILGVGERLGAWVFNSGTYAETEFDSSVTAPVLASSGPADVAPSPIEILA